MINFDHLLSQEARSGWGDTKRKSPSWSEACRPKKISCANSEWCITLTLSLQRRPMAPLFSADLTPRCGEVLLEIAKKRLPRARPIHTVVLHHCVMVLKGGASRAFGRPLVGMRKRIQGGSGFDVQSFVLSWPDFLLFGNSTRRTFGRTFGRWARTRLELLANFSAC